MEGSSLDNVQFDVYTTTYDSDSGREYITSTPTIKNVQGHLQEIYITQENDVDSTRERDKSVRFRLILKGTTQLDTALVLGSYLRVVRKQHPDTNSWVRYVGNEQYIVRYINTINSGGRYLNLGLERKDTN